MHLLNFRLRLEQKPWKLWMQMLSLNLRESYRSTKTRCSAQRERQTRYMYRLLARKLQRHPQVSRLELVMMSTAQMTIRRI